MPWVTHPPRKRRRQACGGLTGALCTGRPSLAFLRTPPSPSQAPTQQVKWSDLFHKLTEWPWRWQELSPFCWQRALNKEKETPTMGLASQMNASGTFCSDYPNKLQSSDTNLFFNKKKKLHISFSIAGRVKICIWTKGQIHSSFLCVFSLENSAPWDYCSFIKHNKTLSTRSQD